MIARQWCTFLGHPVWSVRGTRIDVCGKILNTTHSLRFGVCCNSHTVHALQPNATSTRDVSSDARHHLSLVVNHVPKSIISPVYCRRFCHRSAWMIHLTHALRSSLPPNQITFHPSQHGNNWGGIIITASERMSQSALWSATNNEMLVPRSRLEFGERAFSIAARKAWNSLPADLRVTVNTGTFKKKLEMFIFCKFYTIPCWTFIMLY